MHFEPGLRFFMNLLLRRTLIRSEQYSAKRSLAFKIKKCSSKFPSFFLLKNNSKIAFITQQLWNKQVSYPCHFYLHVYMKIVSTWFDYKTLEVLARNYVLSYNAGAYDFHVNMQVEMTHNCGPALPVFYNRTRWSFHQPQYHRG